jgi:hypothetical protein
MGGKPGILVNRETCERRERGEESASFALAALEPPRADIKWLSRATDAMLEHWRKKNARKNPPLSYCGVV